MPAALQTTPYLKYIIYASLRQQSPKEDITYPVISEFLSEHKQPKDRFLIYPQIVLPWKPDQPQDNHAEVPDFGVGNFSLHLQPHFRLRVGAEAKRALDIMLDLPEPSSIEGNEVIMSVFHALYYQGEDQAKSAIKGGYTLTSLIPFFLFVGPYWASVEYGPFHPAQLTVRTHKPSGSADYGVESKYHYRHHRLQWLKPQPQPSNRLQQSRHNPGLRLHNVALILSDPFLRQLPLGGLDGSTLEDVTVFERSPHVASTDSAQMLCHQHSKIVCSCSTLPSTGQHRPFKYSICVRLKTIERVLSCPAPGFRVSFS